MPVVTFIRKGSSGGTDYAPGAVATLTDAAAAPLAAKQIISVTNNTQNSDTPDAPHAVAALVPSEYSVNDGPWPPLGY